MCLTLSLSLINNNKHGTAQNSKERWHLLIIKSRKFGFFSNRSLATDFFWDRSFHFNLNRFTFKNRPSLVCTWTDISEQVIAFIILRLGHYCSLNDTTKRGHSCLNLRCWKNTLLYPTIQPVSSAPVVIEFMVFLVHPLWRSG